MPHNPKETKERFFLGCGPVDVGMGENRPSPTPAGLLHTLWRQLRQPEPEGWVRLGAGRETQSLRLHPGRPHPVIRTGDLIRLDDQMFLLVDDQRGDFWPLPFRWPLEEPPRRPKDGAAVVVAVGPSSMVPPP